MTGRGIGDQKTLGGCGDRAGAGAKAEAGDEWMGQGERGAEEGHGRDVVGGGGH